MSSPFLTVVTRCYKKPKCLQNNIRSLKIQTDPDYEQIFIVDKVGHGLAAADKALNKYKEYINGKFVLVLDDDDMITNKSFIKTIKNVDKFFSPELIIWRGYFTEIDFVLPPIDTRWNDQPVKFLIGSFNYCVKTELYKKYINLCATGVSGDFDFLEGVVSELDRSKIRWLTNIMAQTQQKSFGKPEDI